MFMDDFEKLPSSTDFFNNLDPDGKMYELAIEYAKSKNVDINNEKELERLYIDVSRSIEELSLMAENEEELEHLNEVFYGLVGLMIDNKKESLNKA